MKRNLFAELMEGVNRLADQREGKAPLRNVETEVPSAADVSAEEISARMRACTSKTP
jgi:putative transcriptional regulator